MTDTKTNIPNPYRYKTIHIDDYYISMTSSPSNPQELDDLFDLSVEKYNTSFYIYLYYKIEYTGEDIKIKLKSRLIPL
jgi:hypothetical protein